MKSARAFVTTGITGITITAICCGLPFLVVVLFTTGLTAWLADAEWLLVVPPLLCLGLILGRMYRKVEKTK
jgi:hypothetical protein